jgi:hypothetical protein
MWTTEQSMKDNSNAFARLRAAEEAERDEFYADGRAAGEQWALDRAQPRQLRRLERWRQILIRDLLDTLQRHAADQPRAQLPLNRHLYEILEGTETDEQDWGDVLAFWKDTLGGRQDFLICLPFFAWGFVEGALEVWDEYKGRPPAAG